MKVSDDDGKQCRLTFGDNILIARNRPSGTPKVDHIAYTLANWDTDKKVRPAVEAELKRRGLQMRATEGSFLIQDPDGFQCRWAEESNKELRERSRGYRERFDIDLLWV